MKLPTKNWQKEVIKGWKWNVSKKRNNAQNKSSNVEQSEPSNIRKLSSISNSNYNINNHVNHGQNDLSEIPFLINLNAPEFQRWQRSFQNQRGFNRPRYRSSFRGRYRRGGRRGDFAMRPNIISMRTPQTTFRMHLNIKARIKKRRCM